MDLDISPLERAIARLEEAVETYHKDTSQLLIRDGLVQRFEFTYELSHKMLKRFLEATSANPGEFDAMTFQDLIRAGTERGLLLSDLPRWLDYRKARGTTSHAYNEDKAREVFAIVPEFLEEARYLCGRLRERLA